MTRRSDARRLPAARAQAFRQARHLGVSRRPGGRDDLRHRGPVAFDRLKEVDRLEPLGEHDPSPRSGAWRWSSPTGPLVERSGAQVTGVLVAAEQEPTSP